MRSAKPKLNKKPAAGAQHWLNVQHQGTGEKFQQDD